MNNDSVQTVAPTKGLWMRFLLLVPLVVVLVLASRAYIRTVAGTYSAITPVSLQDADFAEFNKSDVALSVPGVVEVVDIRHYATGAATVTFRAVSDGETEASLGEGDSQVAWLLQVKNGAIIEGGVDFTGWESIHIGVCIFFAATCALFVSAIVRLWRKAWYGYEMIACGGGLVFCLFQFVFFMYLLLQGSCRAFSDMAFMLTEMAGWFVMISLVPMGVLAVLVSISNIWLIRHEGRRPVNTLGIAASVLWIIAIGVWFYVRDSGFDIGMDYVFFRLIDSVIAVGITFGECLLLSTIACGWLASIHVPGHGADYIVVLGCGIRPDGTPSPLLAGRVDRAFAYDGERTAAGDAPAVFVPSGGQGPDEVMSEAESMCNYLVDKGVQRERIALEDRSTTTRENMVFSREVIEEHAGCDANELAVMFSTTNYHVLRGYVCAHQAGMAVEGMGSKTKAYFWPNAFLREFAGLLANEWKGVLQTYLIFALIYFLAEYILFIQ